MSDLGGDHCEEGLVRSLLDVAVKKFAGLVKKQNVGVDKFVAGGFPAFVVVPSPLAAWIGKRVAFVTLVRWHRNHSVFDVQIQRICGGAVGGHKRFIKALIVGAVDQRRAEFVVDFGDVLESTSQLFAVAAIPSQTEVPFAKDGRFVAGLLKHFGDRQVIWSEVAGAAGSFERSRSASRAEDALAAHQSVA